jgi:lactam utilization protein B
MFTKMEIITLAKLKITSIMDMASTIQKRMAHMKEFGKMERQTAMEKALISKVISILGFM